MANRIQLRRDTAANWTRVNPVLEDGEPGLEIETNRVKYGDGNTTWANLSYSGGGSASFDYSTVQEGSFGPSNLTSITGGDDTGVSLTSENWAQLMWVPNTANVTIEDIGDGPATYTWAFVDDEGFHVAANVDGVKRDWRFTTNGNLELPLGGKIGEVPAPTFVGNAVVITPADGTDDNQQLMIYPTQNEGNHLHLTSGNLAVTDIFLGDDYQYIRTRTDQGMTIGTGGGEMWSGNAWTFGANGILSTPGNVQIGSLGSYGNISFVDTISANSYVYANGVSILDGITGTYGNTEVAAYLTGNVVAGNLTVGNLVVNGNSSIINTESYIVSDNIIQMANANPADTLDLGFVAHRTVNSTLEHTGLVRDASTGSWKLFSNVTAQPGTTVDFTDAVYDSLNIGGLTAGNTNLYSINFTGSPIASSSPGIQWYNGFQSEMYGNVQVERYLGANVGAYQTWANTQIQTLNANLGTLFLGNASTNANLGAYQTWANSYFGTSSYGNTQVTAYLLTWPTANIGTLNSTNGNITTLTTANFSTANAVITGGYATGLANVTVTGNVTVGNLIGSTANTTITAGAYTSSFLSNGMVTIGGNLTVSGNNNNVVTKANFIGATGTATTLDNISANWSGGPAQFQIGTVSGSILAHWNIQTSFNGTFTVSSNNGTLTTSPTNLGGTAGTAGDAITVMLTDITNGRFYRITGQIGPSYLNSPVIIERVV